MLNFSKIKIFIIYFFFSVLAFYTFLNFQNNDNVLLDKKINLGLDLQGGSYLLLEIDTNPLIKEKIQAKVIPTKKLLKDNNIDYRNFSVLSDNLSFEMNELNKKKFKRLFFKKSDNFLNPFITQYNS